MRFDATLELGGRTATGIEVPESVLEKLGGGRRPAVTVTVNGYGYRTTVGSMNGRAMLPVSAEHREAGGLTAGDDVVVDLELDTEERIVDIPDDLAVELAADPALLGAFESLSPSRKRQLVLPLQQAKGAHTRARRVQKAVRELAALAQRS